jgi:hypothetical protein
MDFNTLTQQAVAMLTLMAWRVAGALALWLIGAG